MYPPDMTVRQADFNQAGTGAHNFDSVNDTPDIVVKYEIDARRC